MTEVEIAWVAALLEGEGAFFSTPKKSTTGGVYYEYRVSCNMCDEDVLARLHRLVAVGRLSGPHKRKNPKHKPFYRWNLSKRFEVLDLCMKILPYMGLRRSAKIAEIFDTMSEYKPRATWRHGTRQGYERGCRCADCRAAHAERFMKLRRSQGIVAREPAKHGTRAMYVRHKCRCDDCREAAREYARYRKKQKAQSSNPIILAPHRA